MIILNFSHPLTQEQINQIEIFMGRNIEQVVDIVVRFDLAHPFVPQLERLLSQSILSSDTLRTKLVILNPPSLNSIAVLVVAGLHGKIGYFPPIIRLKPQSDGHSVKYSVAEIIDIQAVRDVISTLNY